VCTKTAKKKKKKKKKKEKKKLKKQKISKNKKKQEKKLVNTEHRDESPSTRPRTIMRVFRKQRDSATRFVIFNGTVPNQAVTVDNVSVRFRRLTVLLVHYLNETAIRRINSRFEPIDRSRASSSFRQ